MTVADTNVNGVGGWKWGVPFLALARVQYV